MITVNMHEAKTRLSELVKAVEERDEIVVLCRDGREVAEIRRRAKRPRARNLTADARFSRRAGAGLPSDRTADRGRVARYTAMNGARRPHCRPSIGIPSIG